MKILTKEEEDAHYATTIKGGLTGGAIGLAVGGAALYGASRRFQIIRGLTVPMKAYLVSATGTFTAIIYADRASRGFELQRNPENRYVDTAARTTEALEAEKTSFQRVKDWGRENRYPIVTASWVASMGIALGLVGRNPYLSRAQKLVQARVDYAEAEAREKKNQERQAEKEADARKSATADGAKVKDRGEY
ncbi:hypothetical protein BUE80_DR007453 [Diplocarpon rosae]|nr:hypothetical protein BUE80_DR007453 [Diplocarpon rosae]